MELYKRYLVYLAAGSELFCMQILCKENKRSEGKERRAQNPQFEMPGGHLNMLNSRYLYQKTAVLNRTVLGDPKLYKKKLKFRNMMSVKVVKD